MLGVVVAIPVLLWNIWKFVAVGLNARERGLAFFFFPPRGDAVLHPGLVLGFLFALPFFFAWLLAHAAKAPTMYFRRRQSDYLDDVIFWTMSTGRVMDVPWLVMVLMRLGIVGSATLTKFRKYVVGINVVLACCLCPSTDFVSVGLTFPAHPAAVRDRAVHRAASSRRSLRHAARCRCDRLQARASRAIAAMLQVCRARASGGGDQDRLERAGRRRRQARWRVLGAIAAQVAAARARGFRPVVVSSGAVATGVGILAPPGRPPAILNARPWPPSAKPPSPTAGRPPSPGMAWWRRRCCSTYDDFSVRSRYLNLAAPTFRALFA